MTQPDGLHMDTDATTHVMHRVTAIGDQLDRTWEAVTARLADATAQLGGGELGAAFMAGYQETATQTAAAVERHRQMPGRLAAVGHESIAGYLSADQRSGGHFRALNSVTRDIRP